MNEKKSNSYVRMYKATTLFSLFFLFGLHIENSSSSHKTISFSCIMNTNLCIANLILYLKACPSLEGSHFLPSYF